MTTEQVKIKLFIIEGLEGFKKLGFRQKCSSIINRSTDGIQKEYYKLAVKNNFENPWENFETFLINNCTGETLEDVKKFSRESWKKFLDKMNVTAVSRGIDDDILTEDLKKKVLPSNIQMLVL